MTRILVISISKPSSGKNNEDVIWQEKRKETKEVACKSSNLFTLSNPTMNEEMLLGISKSANNEMNQFLCLPFTTLGFKEAFSQMDTKESLKADGMLSQYHGLEMISQLQFSTILMAEVCSLILIIHLFS